MINKNMVAEIDDKCMGCGMCLEVCPVEAIDILKSDGGWSYAKADKLICIGCGACIKVDCPSDAIHMVERKKKEKTCDSCIHGVGSHRCKFCDEDLNEWRPKP